MVNLPSASDPRTSGLDDVSLPLPILIGGEDRADIWQVRFSPDGSRIYAAGNDKVVRVWDVESGAQIDVFRIPRWTGYDGAIYAMDLSPDGRFIAVGGCQGCSGRWEEGDSYLVYLGDLESMQIIGGTSAHAPVHDLAFSPDGQRLATAASNGSLRIFRVSREQGLIEEAVLPGHHAGIVGLAWQQDQSGVYTAGRDGLLVRWSRHPAGGWFADWKVEHDVRLSAIAATPDGKWIAVASQDGHLVLREAENGEKVGDLLDLKSGRVASLVAAADSRSIAYGTAGGAWKQTGFGVLSLPEGRRRFFAKGRNSAWDLAWHQGEDSLLAASEGDLGSVSVIDTRTRKELIRLGGSPAALSTVASNAHSVIWKRSNQSDYPAYAFDTDQLSLRARPPARFYRSAGDSKVFNVRVNSPEEGFVSYMPSPNRMGRQVPVISGRIVTWSAMNDEWLALGGESELILLNTLDPGKHRRCHGHTSSVNDVSPHGVDDNLLISASSDRTIRFWNLRTCELLLTFHPTDDEQWVAWTPLGLWAASERGGALLGFQVNQGAHRTPVVYPSSQLSGLNRPDLIREILQRGSAEGTEVEASDREIRGELD